MEATEDYEKKNACFLAIYISTFQRKGLNFGLRDVHKQSLKVGPLKTTRTVSMTVLIIIYNQDAGTHVGTEYVLKSSCMCTHREMQGI